MASKVFIVTGASRGIGAAITKRLLSQSHKVILAARSQEPLEAVKTSHPGQVEYLAGDLTDPNIATKIVDLAVETFGKIDGLVINHGILAPKKLADSSIEDFRHVYDVNVFSYLTMAKAALRELRKSKGSIVWVSSGAASGAYVAWGAYGSSKAATNSIAAHIAVEEPDITSIAVAPGRVDTDMQATIRSEGKDIMDEAQYKSFVDAFNQGVLLKPEQPGNVIAGLVAEPAKELSGKFLSWNSQELAAYRQ
ncbi:putative oxidoreductase C30D10.05c-like protein [Hapsidospora chrysogenum ATCC 11550]|uniref:Putative oxidoreductase C30D10.05c-like protein n=1 Tax=Hapsidospora chrysogenum (strain ATCC 11550 / CBS 779.69 / DSM 880 / IAM 14645 / JCM 23072 / IMI 49137) TaxID=857340 RepID=A0A086TDL0_HAPC1|nr:putative oxidoreductase C30D10.05c-like protein [Hapsidospora chrysogenum ATCC 11550]